MTDSDRNFAAKEAGSDSESVIGTPRWVKVFAIIGLILIVLVVVMILIGGNHGPGRHS